MRKTRALFRCNISPSLFAHARGCGASFCPASFDARGARYDRVDFCRKRLQLLLRPRLMVEVVTVVVEVVTVVVVVVEVR